MVAPGKQSRKRWDQKTQPPWDFLPGIQFPPFLTNRPAWPRKGTPCLKVPGLALALQLPGLLNLERVYLFPLIKSFGFCFEQKGEVI